MASPEVFKISVTDADSTHTDFSPVAYKVNMKNTGTASCYINLNGTALISHFKLESGDEMEMGLATITDVHAICDTGEITVLRIVGEKQW